MRESLFAALESADAVRDAAVLDLYAGSGALGLEAASRGAAGVDLVEKAPRAVAVAQRNARKVARALANTTPIRVHRTTATAFLREPAGPWDLVLIDPPYDLADDEVTTMLGALVPSLAPSATVVLERATRSGTPNLPPGLAEVQSRRYGDTTLWWLAVA